MDTDEFMKYMEDTIFRYVHENNCKTMRDVVDVLLCDARLGSNSSLYNWFFSHGHLFELACRYNRIGLLAMFLSPVALGGDEEA